MIHPIVRFVLVPFTSAVFSLILDFQAWAQDILPRPEQPFGGSIGLKAKDSIGEFPREVTAPKGAPNVLLILTDDVGFGASSSFGGPIPTVTMDRLAASGLRFNNFHTTALCSPSRASLLSGRNHHSAATGVIMEMGSGFPGYNSLMPKAAEHLPRFSSRTAGTPLCCVRALMRTVCRWCSAILIRV